MNARVLIVDDSLTVRMDLAEELEAAGFAVSAVGSLAAARAALAEQPHDLAILDIHLPDGDGIDFLAELRARPATAALPVLLLSSEADVRDRLRARDTGADDYLGKPYDVTHVVERAAALCRRPAAPAASSSSSGKPRLLIIDDSPTFRARLAASLESAGYDVVQAGSGEDGLKLAARLRPNAVVVDGILPGIDGATVIKRLRLDPALRRVPCLLLTGTEGAVEELVGLESGADVYLRKDDNFDLVRARLSALLRSTTQTGEPDAAVAAAAPIRILAVDDSPTFLHTLADNLRRDGYDVAAARSGREALAFLAVDKVDAVLLDVIMPEMSGEETCRLIKADPRLRDLPVIMLTAREDREAMIAGLNAGADDYIAKSSDIEILRGRLRAQLRRKHFEDETQRMRDELHRKEVEAREARAARQLADTRALLLADVEQKNVELERARSAAVDASRFKSEFLANMSHEIRTPMNAIIGFSDLLFEEETDAVKRERLQVVKTAGRGLLALIDDILDFSKIEAGKLEITHAPFAPRALAKQLEELFGFAARKKGLALDVTVAASVPVRLLGDDHRVSQVLTNLLGNAFKFTSAGGVSLRLDYEDDGVARFAVRDSGIGIPAAQQQRVFAAFEQADRSTTRQFGGTGLGLAITKNLVELMGGKITMASVPGEGSTFTVVLPLPAVAADAGEAMVQRWLDAQGLPELKELVVENLATRMADELDALERAVHADDGAEVRRLAHAIKGWSGSYQMTELYDLIAAIDAAPGEARSIIGAVRALMDSIPTRYRRAVAPPAPLALPRRDAFKLLVVDDNEMNRLLMRTLIGKLGLECDMAENGLRALEMLAEHPYDLVLLDMEMPVMDGWQAIRAIRADARTRDLDVVALTAHAVNGSAERCLAAGCNGYMAKPIDFATFFALIQERMVRAA